MDAPQYSLADYIKFFCICQSWFIFERLTVVSRSVIIPNLSSCDVDRLAKQGL